MFQLLCKSERQHTPPFMDESNGDRQLLAGQAAAPD
jgi:hypothetical protein